MLPPNNLGTPATYSHKSKLKWFLLATTIIIILILSIGFYGIFVKVNGQTLATTTLDSLGLHKLAMQVEAINNNPALAALSSINPADSNSCNQLWQHVDSVRAPRVEAFSAQFFTSIKPIDQKYQKDFNFEMYWDGAVDFNKQQTISRFEASSRVNGDIITNSLKSPSVNQQISGMYEFQLSVNGYANLDATYLSLPYFAVKGNGYNTKDNMANWYKYDLDFSNTQKTGFTEMARLYIDLTEIKVRDMFSQNTGEMMMRTMCMPINSIDVGLPSQTTFGKYSNSVFARPITVTLKDNNEKDQYKAFWELNKQMADDQQFLEFQKNQFENVVRFNRAKSQIEKNNYTEQTKAEFDKEVEERTRLSQESYKEFPVDDSSDSENDYKPIYNIVNKPIVYYIDINTGYLAGVKIETEIKATQEGLSNFNLDSELSNILQTGFIITQEVYGINFNNDVTIIVPPNDQKVLPFDDFWKDFENTALYRRSEELLEKYLKEEEEEAKKQCQADQDMIWIQGQGCRMKSENTDKDCNSQNNYCYSDSDSITYSDLDLFEAQFHSPKKYNYERDGLLDYGTLVRLAEDEDTIWVVIGASSINDPTNPLHFMVRPAVSLADKVANSTENTYGFDKLGMIKGSTKVVAHYSVESVLGVGP